MGIIYTDNLIGDNGKPIDTSPAATYAVCDMAQILDYILKGELVCGTGQPYPVITDDDNQPPWDTINNNGPVGGTPWSMY